MGDNPDLLKEMNNKVQQFKNEAYDAVTKGTEVVNDAVTKGKEVVTDAVIKGKEVINGPANAAPGTGTGGKKRTKHHKKTKGKKHRIGRKHKKTKRKKHHVKRKHKKTKGKKHRVGRKHHRTHRR